MPGWVSASQALSRVSNINFDIWFFFWREGVPINIPWKIPNSKVLAHLGFKSKVLPGPLTDLGVWVGFCTSSPQQGVKYQPSISMKCLALGHSLLYIYQRHSRNFRIYRSCIKTSIKDANTIKFGLKIILTHLPETTVVYAIPYNIFFQNTTKRKELFSLKRTTLIGDLTPLNTQFKNK